MLQMTLIFGNAALFFVLERTIPLSSLLENLLWLDSLFCIDLRRSPETVPAQPVDATPYNQLI